MKYVKMLGALVVAATALMAFAGSASAGTITSPTGTVVNSLTATAGVTTKDGAFSSVSCNKSHMAGTITSQGAGQTVKSTLSTLTFNECNFPTTVKKAGTLEIHSIRKGIIPHETCIVNYCSGTITSSGTETEISTSVGTCVFTTANTAIGVLTGTDATGGTAVLDIAGKIPRTAGNFLCGSSATWTGSYSFTSPDTLWVDE